MEVTIALLQKAITKSGKKRFLVDGFPRAMDQALKFEETVVEGKGVLYFECPERVLLERLLARGKTSGRADDNVESIQKRFRTFHDTSYPVIEYYQKKGMVHTITCENTPDKVYEETKKVMVGLFETK
jgi:UMP-CMP kinase